MATYKFPNDIDGKLYAFKRLTITIYEQNTQDIKKIIKGAADQASDTYKAYYEFFTNDSVNSIPEIGKRKLVREVITPKDVIQLPLPNELTDNQSHSWSEEPGMIGTLGEKLQSANLSGMATFLPLSGLRKIGEKTDGPLTDFGTKITDSLSRFGNIVGGNITVNKALGSLAATSGTRKALVNPGLFQNYGGSSLRNFSFSWDFIPRDPDEAKNVLEIVQKFKKYSSPQLSTNGVTINAPYQFDIKIGNPIIDELLQMRQMVIKEVNVSYGADGSMQMYPDGMPKQIRLSISVSDTYMQTQADYNSDKLIGSVTGETANYYTQKSYVPS